MKLHFKNSQGKEKLIAECETVGECHKKIQKFLDDHDYKSYYLRTREHDGRIQIDVGSYSEFFFIDGISHVEYMEALYDEADDAYYKSQQFEPFEDEEYHQITTDDVLENLLVSKLHLKRLKLAEKINSFFGCDAAYFGINPYDLAAHLLDNGVNIVENNSI